MVFEQLKLICTKPVSELQDMLINAVSNLINGRPGPVWLSIPVDIQGMLIEELDIPIIKKELNIELSDISSKLDIIHTLLSQSKRPLIIAGNGIKVGNCIDKFNNFINKYNIPVVVTMLSTDIIETDNTRSAPCSPGMQSDVRSM